MKEEYSKINHPGLREAKKLYKKDIKIFRDTDKRLQSEFDRLAKNKENNISIFTIIIENKFYETIIKDKAYENYYIESKDLLSFFNDTKIKEQTLLNVTEFLNNNYKIINKTIDSKGNIKDEKLSAGIIYDKINHESLFFMVTISEFSNYKTPFCYVTNGKTCAITPLSVDFLHNINTYKENNIFRRVLNMLFYMDAFPDKISNKPPEEMCDKLNFNNSKTISISKDIEDYLHENREVSPHLRRGHFRFLDSDRFVNKKGQTVFVKSSFVKGKAVTITD